jgi:lipopolysaccharide transport system permease protein
MDKMKTLSTERIIKARRGFVPIDFAELWRFRELFWFLALRDILVRYKQTVIGIAWAVIQPILIMIVFTVIFGRLAKMPSNGIPYPILTFVALLPWQFFSDALSQASQSVVSNAAMVSKIYFPRLIIPASAIISGIVNFFISFGVLIVLMIWYHVVPTAAVLFLPLFFILAIATALGVSLWLSALNVEYRDVKYVMPFIVRLGLYVSPVGFLSSVVPEKYRLLYSLNPMVGVIDGFRWCILGDKITPYWPGLWLSVGIVTVLLISGAYFFKRVERTFADVI